MTSSSLNSDCCNQKCSRTWVTRNISKTVAYLFLEAEYVEEWMEHTDVRRDNLIQKGDYHHPIAIQLFELVWTLELAAESIGQWFGWFKS